MPARLGTGRCCSSRARSTNAAPLTNRRAARMRPRRRRQPPCLFFLGADSTVMAAEVTTRGRELTVCEPKALLVIRAPDRDVRNRFAVSPDGQRILVNTPDTDAQGAPAHVWTRRLEPLPRLGGPGAMQPSDEERVPRPCQRRPLKKKPPPPSSRRTTTMIRSVLVSMGRDGTRAHVDQQSLLLPLQVRCRRRSRSHPRTGDHRRMMTARHALPGAASTRARGNGSSQR